MSPAHRSRDRHTAPGDLHIAARWVHRTRDRVLWSARQYREGKIVWPLRLGDPDPATGRRFVTDDATSGGYSRTFEIAAALDALTDAGLDPLVLFALRETPWVSDDQAFGALAMGMTPAEAVQHAQADTFPPVRVMFAMAALRGVDLTSIWDDEPVPA